MKNIYEKTFFMPNEKNVYIKWKNEKIEKWKKEIENMKNEKMKM